MRECINTTTIPATEHEASLGWYAIIFSAVCVYAAGYFGILLPDFVMTRCGIQNNTFSKTIGFSLSTILAIHQFLAILVSRVEWNETYISYRAWNFKKYIVPITDVVDESYVFFSWKKIEFRNTPTLFYFVCSVDLEKFEEFAYRTRLHSHTHEFYFPAERQVIYDGAKCGCMSCLSIFSKEHILNWVGEDTDKKFNKDRVVCPSCNKWEFVLTDQGKVLMNLPNLQIAAKKYDVMDYESEEIEMKVSSEQESAKSSQSRLRLT